MSTAKKSPLHTKIFFGMVAGIAAGLIIKHVGLAPETLETIVSWVEPIGQIFLRMVFMTVIPLVFAALVLGIAEIGDLHRHSGVSGGTSGDCDHFSSIGVPGEAIGLIYGVDRILDMFRTVLNVTGDITAAAYIQRVEERSADKQFADERNTSDSD